ncbi:MAG: hypothetical protein ACJ754_01790 [Pyrinomonadaceae bacterium]
MRRPATLLLLLIVIIISPYALAQKRDLPPKPTREMIWGPKEPYADEVLADGASIRIIKQDGLMVGVTGYDSGDYLVIEVAVLNGSDKRVDIHPEDFFLVYWDKKDKFGYGFSLDAQKVAKKYENRAAWGNFFRSFAAGMATRTITSQTIESGSVSTVGSGGTASGIYSSTATTTSTAPNTEALRNAAAANATATTSADERTTRIMNAALRANSIFPREDIQGLVYFKREKFKVSKLYIIIDSTAYVFLFGGSDK